MTKIKAKRKRWDLGPVFDILQAFQSATNDLAPKLAEKSIEHEQTTINKPSISQVRTGLTLNREPSTFSPDSAQKLFDDDPPSLGNFEAIFAHLSTSINIYPIQSWSSDTKSISSDDADFVERDTYSTAASSPPDDSGQHFDDFVKTKSVRFAEDERSSPEKPVIWPSVGRADWKALDINELRRLVASNEPILGIEVKSEDSHGISDSETESLNLRKIHNKRSAAGRGGPGGSNANNTIQESAKYLTPAWVTPVPLPSVPPATPVHINNAKLLEPSEPYIKLDPQVINPILYLTIEEKKTKLAKKLLQQFSHDPSSLMVSNFLGSITQLGGNIDSAGIHVFIDSSNITIGFQHALKKARNMNINTYVRRPPIDFHSLAMILERGRGVAKRELVGSSRSNKRPEYMEQAVVCGYAVSALEPVEKMKIANETGRRRTGTGYGTSGQSSGSEGPQMATMKVTEQGVDEILHMKMLESLVDVNEPSTIVLASGDAAEAEYSSGFFKNVERALERGWNVELVAWRDSMSHAYRSAPFLKKWKGQFKVILLDDFSEELLAIYVLPRPSKFGMLLV